MTRGSLTSNFRRLAKLPIRCKKTPCLVLLCCTFGGTPHAAATDAEQALRECVGKATSSAAVIACETAARAALQRRVAELTDAIRDRVSAKDRIALESNVAAWEAFAKEENRLITLFYAKRRDNLGAQLTAGAVNQLLEQRISQLRAYLHSLSN